MKSSGRKQNTQFFIHSIIWIIIAFFPLIFMFSEGERNIIRLLDFAFPIVFLMIVFYANYFVIIKKFLFNKKLWHFFAVNVLLFAICLSLLFIMREWFFAEHYKQLQGIKHLPPRSFMLRVLMYRDFISMSVTVGLATAIRMTMQWYISQAEQKELEKLHVESELNNLKHQLNPHFLFNTLNNIYALISTNQENAQNAVHQLSNLIRYVLYESDHTRVSLRKDLAFTTNFIELMRLRLPTKARLETHITPVTEDIEIAPLLFISLVENAFKHGINPVLPSYVSIAIELSQNKQLICRIENSNFSKETSDLSGSGIGLNNLKKRLELLYPSASTLKFEQTASHYIATLTLLL